MKKILAGCLLSSLSLIAFAESELIMKQTPYADSAWQKFNPNHCGGMDKTKIPQGSTVILVDTYTCKLPPTNVKFEFVQVAYGGDIYYMNKLSAGITDNDMQKVNTLTESEKEQLKKDALTKSMMLKLDGVEKVLNDVKRTSVFGISLMKSSVYDESEVTEGTGIEMQYLNSTKKRIKYVTAVVVGYNGVDDPVKASFTRKYEVVLKGVGPIEPDETATYKKEYAWHTDVVEYIKIKSIKVDYMDGTSKTITKPESARLKESTIKSIETGAY